MSDAGLYIRRWGFDSPWLHHFRYYNISFEASVKVEVIQTLNGVPFPRIRPPEELKEIAYSRLPTQQKAPEGKPRGLTMDTQQTHQT